MPWKACSAMEERLRFVAQLPDGEGISELCWEFGISRTAGAVLLAEQPATADEIRCFHELIQYRTASRGSK